MPEEEGIDDALEGFRAKNDEIYHAVLAMLGQRNTPNSIAGITSTRIDDVDIAEKENHSAEPLTNASSKRTTSNTAATSNAPARGKGRPAKAAATPKTATGTKKELNISVSCTLNE